MYFIDTCLPVGRVKAGQKHQSSYGKLQLISMFLTAENREESAESR